MLNLKDKIIVTAALTGALTPKDLNKDIPLTPQEIAEDALRCEKAGAAVVHMHMRDDNGKGTMEPEKFKETIKLIKESGSKLVINCTSSGERGASDERRLSHFPLLEGVELGSFDAGTFNWMPDHVFMNTPAFLEKLANLYLEKDIKPEIEVFDSGMLGVADFYIKKGLIKTPAHYQFCLGIVGGMPATAENLLYLKNHLPQGSTWSAFGVGKDHLSILFTAIALGGHIRVGLEDNVYFSKGVKATNEQLVKRAVDAIKLFGKEPASPDEAREILGLKPLK